MSLLIRGWRTQGLVPADFLGFPPPTSVPPPPIPLTAVQYLEIDCTIMPRRQGGLDHSC